MPHFFETQHKLAKAIRLGDAEHEFEARRIKIYQELFFNNVEGFCAGAFPVLKSLFAQQQWLDLIRSFFVQHQCETPHFVEISQEFLHFLTENTERLPHPAMMELAHYEWVELASSVAEAQMLSDSELDVSSDSNQKLWLPESTWPVAYQYPVHTITADNIAQVEPKMTNLIVYRDDSYEIRFIETDQLTVWLLNNLQQNDLGFTVAELSQLLTSESVGLTAEQTHSYLQQALPALLKRKILAIR